MVDSFLGQAEEGNKTALLKLQLIGHYIMGGDFSITDLSHEMNLSVPTVTKLVSELIEEGFVHDFGKQGTAGGRRPNIYGLNPYAGYFVGVDIKKDIITLAIINFKGQVVDMRDCVPFVMENSVQALDRLCDVVNGFIAKSKIDRAKIFSVGFNLSGRVNSKTGYSYSYFFVEEEPLTMLLEKRLGCKVYVENDTRAMTYGEYMCGVGNNEDTMIFVNASWGLGVGLVIDRKLFYGRSGFSGEFGHFPLLDNEVICRCGKRGCLETGASGSAVHRIFMEKLAQRVVFRCFPTSTIAASRSCWRIFSKRWGRKTCLPSKSWKPSGIRSARPWPGSSTSPIPTSSCWVGRWPWPRIILCCRSRAPSTNIHCNS